MTEVIEERPSDIESITRVLLAAFPNDAESRLVTALRAANRLTISLVARGSMGEVIGHIAFSPVIVEGATGGLGLAPVSVHPDWQGRGVGRALIEEGLARCRALGAPFVVLLGAPAYYGRFGFVAAKRFGLVDAYGGGEAFQVTVLVDGGLASARGLVRYAPEFAIFE